MDKQKLTQKIVANASCPDGKRFEYIMDAALPGFGVQVTAAGSKSYIIRFQSKGRRECRTFAPVESMTLTAARARARELIGAYLRGEDPLKVEKKKSVPKLTILQLYKKWEKWASEQKLERITTRNMIGAIGLYFDIETKKAESLTARDLENYKNERTKKGNKPLSINRMLRELKYLYAWANTQGLLSPEFRYPEGVKNLSEAMLSPKTDHLSDVEVKKLLDTVDKLVSEKPDKGYLRPIILFALNTGIRTKSIVQLEWRDVVRLDADGGELHIRAACIKTRKDENISLSAAAASILKELESRGKHADTDRIFTNYTTEHINKSIKKLMVAAGLEKYSAYSLRHNYATSLYLAGATPIEIQLQMCHRNFRTTQKYIHTDFAHQKQVANLLSFGPATKAEAAEATV